MMGTLDAGTDSETVQLLLRELAATTRTMTPPAETATMVGALAGGLAALREILDQLAGLHERSADTAVDVTGDGDAGYRGAFDVALQLSQAAMEVERAAASVEAAHHTARGLAWPSVTRPANGMAGPPDRRLVPPSLFSDSRPHHDPAGISR